MKKKITDISSRFTKTLFQSFLACIIVEAILFVVFHFVGLYEIDFANIYFWIVTIGFAIVTSLIAGLTSVIQNKAINKRHKGPAEKRGGKR